MYGTVAQIRLKPGKLGDLLSQLRQLDAVKVPGFVRGFTYRMDADPNEFYLVVAFEDKASYVANANSPEQDARYRQMAELFAAEPAWHDGEIVYASD